MASTTTIASLILFALLFTTLLAHSNLGTPLAYSRTACKASESWCKGSCPPIWKTGKGKARNSASNPAAVWQRGQEVEIIWHKNNHIGGFYRRSLVPVKYMFDESWHKRTAFDYGCWQQGTFQCGKNEVCGADAKGKAYRNKITIPRVFPDGDYVFAQVWFGGLHWRGTYSKYSDYFACSFVRIQGGASVISRYDATFTGKDKKCKTGKTFPLDCKGDGCGMSRKSFTAVPREWQGGKKPYVLASTFGVDAMKDSKIVTDSQANEKKAMQEVEKDAKNDALAAKESGYSDSAGITRASSSSYRGPVKNVRVIVDGKIVAELRDGDQGVVNTGGKSVALEAYTGRYVGNLWFQVPGEKQSLIRSQPYVYRKNFKYNERFAITVVHWAGRTRTELKVYLTLRK